MAETFTAIRTRQACVEPGVGLLAGLAKHPVADRHDQAAVLGDGMNCAGETSRASGCVQRISASAPVIAPVLRSTLGW